MSSDNHSRFTKVCSHCIPPDPERCNFCFLEDLKKLAAVMEKELRTVPWALGVLVLIDDVDAAWIIKLPNHCVCEKGADNDQSNRCH